MYGMEYQKALKSGIIVATLLVTVSLATQQQQQPAYSSSGAFDQGYEDGKDARLNDGSNRAYCDPYNNAQNPDAYCTAYKAGFAAGWTAAGLLYGDQ